LIINELRTPKTYLKTYLKTLSQNTREKICRNSKKKKRGGNPLFLAIAEKITKNKNSLLFGLRERLILVLEILLVFLPPVPAAPPHCRMD